MMFVVHCDNTLSAQQLLTRTIGGHTVDVRTPKGATRADVLVLPGWNFAAADWGKHTPLYRYADSLGLRLVMPEMRTSIYASRFYPETKAGYRIAPTLTWVTDTLLTALASEGILARGGRNFLLGLSTGARGVVRVAWATDSLFTAGAALSGDYAHLDTTDKLLIQSYGPYSKFRARWALDEPILGAATIRVPLYLAHGEADRVVPHRHTVQLGIALRVARGDSAGTVVIRRGAGHDWAYWSTDLLPALSWMLAR
jgi:S-formylglutathione hydrolase FrmB